MQRNKALWLGLVIVLMLILVGTKEYMGWGASSYQDMSSTSTTTTQSATQTKSQAPVSSQQAVTKSQTVVATTTPVSAHDQCVASKEQQLKDQGTSYQKGSLLVTFAKDVSWQQGKDILSLYNIAYSAETEAQGGFTTKSWVDVSVPQGSEISLLCTLQTDSHIKYVGVNPIFKLHE